ncbi:DUF1002 domain-containing protein [Guptibacillus hwajinpoensis]|uniref:Uncharacterized protein YpuA (DUF1002 family) n=1 Tax=Guptibacillus hwajinpoensis TaxID=208199 RepID=A0ABU0JX09_9BACL|nr:DUF1002 domain-containing protein [Alkalihalobacillus hemicentroti]MDQ0481619.1 uncharacterized protein YpuA (DUF1002 family) [Alkalihalobacillus hemicentroti]
MLKKAIPFILSMLLIMSIMPVVALADASVGDVIVTLGEDLTEDQKQNLLGEMDAPKDVMTVTVSNEEEHKYLGDYISKALIGTRALSSSSITIGEKDAGLSVETKNINWVTDEMYANALITAGVKDADIYVTAPIEVSGTAALTGLIKAYELSSDKVIPEEQKQVANEELVTTAKLSDSIGADKATELMTKVKDEIATNPPETEEELRTLIKQIASDSGIELTQDELDGLVALFNRMKDLNIDWDQMKSQLENARENLDEFLNKEETQSFIGKIIDFFIALIDGLKGLFKS